MHSSLSWFVTAISVNGFSKPTSATTALLDWDRVGRDKGSPGSHLLPTSKIARPPNVHQ